MTEQKECLYGKIPGEGKQRFCGGADPDGCALLSQLNRQTKQQLADANAGKLNRGETLNLLIGHGKRTLETAEGSGCKSLEMKEAIEGFKRIMNEAKINSK